MSLTQNTTQFAKSILGFVDAALKLYAIPLHPVIRFVLVIVRAIRLEIFEDLAKSTLRC